MVKYSEKLVKKIVKQSCTKIKKKKNKNKGGQHPK